MYIHIHIYIYIHIYILCGDRRVGEADVGCSDQERFKTELEFVQCLASAQYVNCKTISLYLNTYCPSSFSAP